MQTTTFKFAIIVSQFNEAITEKLLDGAMNRLHNHSIPKNNITVIHVPGAIEIPLIAKQLAKRKEYDAIICLGAVIRGDTDHYDYVCQQVSNGCMQIMLEFDIPVIFGILTTNNEQQALDRVGGKEGHKGSDAADAAILMSDIMRKLKI